ncbi:peptidase domain-containing ABC transporter [Methylotuvimicrobium buryatense]|uniref:ATP-binding cassette domain-containing protein n=1 Tax=Methylotuvimicrobium buryatense TaxID=95641 RepID=A0A4V1IJE0_METBY|nr:ATP-binding cassette domain-containing protein [Methylotuvimicrobium buryatense]QCW81075.1 ATP-binding cassette domain-containing protein [Methylotuvimicrobium buryatense]
MTQKAFSQTVLRTLFDYLLSEMGSSAHDKGLHQHEVPSSAVSENFHITANNLGLISHELMLTIDQAAIASGHLTQLLKPLDDGRWLVLSGFSRGRIKGTLIDGHVVTAHVFKLNELMELLNCPCDRLLEWHLIELKAPMDASSHHEHDHEHMPPLQRLFEMIKVEKKDLWHVIVLAIASGLLSLATPAAVQSLVNTVALGGMMQPLTVLSTLLFIFLVFYGAISIIQSYLVELIQRRVFVRMAADLGNRLPNVEWSKYDDKNGQELVNRFFDILTVQKAGAFLLLDGFAIAMQGAIGLLVLAAYHPLLLLFGLIVVLWISFVIFVQGRKGVETSIDESYAKYAVVAWLETLARNGQTFKFSGGPELARERTDELAYEYLNTRKRHYRILLNQQYSLYALYAVASTTLLAVGGILVMEGQLSLGQLVAAELIVSGVLASFAQLKKKLESYYDLMAGVDKLGHLLDLTVERETGDVLKLSEPAHVGVYDLTLTYHNRYTAFKNMTFEIMPGEKVALFGGPGTGKSSIAELLTGLRVPSHGHVEINHIDMREIRLESLRQSVAVAGRTEIIEDTIIENVRLGRPDISVHQVRDIANRLGIFPDQKQLPEGLYTVLNSAGSPLSSSQTRKLLLARAIIGNPRVLILDELLDDWKHFADSPARDVLFADDAPWTLLVLTGSKTIAQLCQRTIDL